MASATDLLSALTASWRCILSLIDKADLAVVEKSDKTFLLKVTFASAETYFLFGLPISF